MKIIKKIKNNIFIKKIGKNVYGIIIKVYMFFCNKVFGVDKESIVFISFGGKTYSDNPKAISEKLHDANPHFKIIWLFIEPDLKKDIVPEYVTCFKVNSFKALKTLATSKFWVDNLINVIYL